MRSRYTWLLEGELLIIEDLGLPGCQSVCDDIEAVLHDMAERGVRLRRQRIIYRDAAGGWDGIVAEDGQFLGFVHLAARSREGAVAAALARPDWRPFQRRPG
jgi:hypothetical protein